MSAEDEDFWLIFHGIAGRTVVLKKGARAAYDAAREAADRGQVVEIRDFKQNSLALDQLLARVQGLG